MKQHCVHEIQCMQSPMCIMTIEQLRDKYQLQVHPEGGYYARQYESMIQIDNLNASFRVIPRAIVSSIVFLLPAYQVSRLHRIPGNEIWCFHVGLSLTIVEIEMESGLLIETKLGMRADEKMQYVVKGGNIFGAYHREEDLLGQNDSTYSFVSCLVAPSFHFDDFYLCKQNELLITYPQHADMIHRMTSKE